MTSLLVPRRRRGVEYLDDPRLEPHVRERSLADVARSNALFGGTSAVIREFEYAVTPLRNGAEMSLLDVGTGIGDIPQRMRERAASRGIRLTVIGVENAEELARASSRRIPHAVCASALALPFRDASVDVVACSQLLHHFDDAAARAILREMNRVARYRVIVSDIRRSWLAAAGIWLASYPLRFHPVSRHDGVVSVLRGFTLRELRALVQSAVGVTPVVHSRRGFRVTASWSPVGAAEEIRSDPPKGAMRHD